MKFVKWTVRLVILAAIVIAVQTAAVTARSSSGSPEDDVKSWATLFTQRSASAAGAAADLAVQLKDTAVNTIASRAE